MQETILDILESQEEDILTDKKIKAIAQNLLFIYGDPLSPEEIRDIIDENIDLRRIKRCLNELVTEMDVVGHGLKLFVFNNKYQLGTDKKYSKYIEKLITPSKHKSLTTSALETLTIIAYKQPVTRIEVEDIRGVKSNAVFETLLNHDLIEVVGRAKKIGNPKLFATTKRFLELMGMKSLDELPDLEKHKNKQISI